MDHQDFIHLLLRCRVHAITSPTAIISLVHVVTNGDATCTELARACSVSTAAITGAVDTLSGDHSPRKGLPPLVKRVPKPGDRRTIIIVPTELGKLIVIPTQR